ncbi:MAG: c-type cytochrome [Planctomycetaceae bacterium]|nr:c-type cytochrome [Planctomycetaceae bacterium]
MTPPGDAADSSPADSETEPSVDLATDAPPEGPTVPTPATPTEPAPASANQVLLGSAELTAGIPGDDGPLSVEEIHAWLDQPENHEVLEIELPLGLKAGGYGKDLAQTAPLTRAKIELGRQLYFDTRLSADNTVSCATCHAPDEGWARHTQFGEGIGGQKGGRNSPVSYNRIASGAQFWDGRAASLEDQAVGPIANPIEMGHTHDAVVTILQGVEGYRLQFERIFGSDKITIDDVGRAIAAFERAVVTGPTPYDYRGQLEPFLKLTEEDFADDAELKQDYETRLAEADAHPMSESALRGRNLFFSEKINCAHCHVGANFSDEKYHNLGVGMDRPEPDLGRYNVTKDDKDRGAFKTPTIRNVAQTAPYMHDGSQKTLLEVVEHYQKGGTPNPSLSPKIVKLVLSDQDKLDLVAFMEACTGEFPEVQPGRLPE